MWAFIIIVGILWFTIFMPLISDRSSHYNKKQSYNGIKISQKESRDIDTLQKEIHIPNKYCKKQVTTLFISVNKEFPLEVKAAQQRNVLSFCECIVLRELNYLAERWSDEVEFAQAINNPVLCDEIQNRVPKFVVKITGEENDAFYDSNGDAWEIRYAHLIGGFTPNDVAYFYKEVCKLANLNAGRISVNRRIYTKSYQFLVKIDREYALRSYIRSLYFNTNAKISARNRKILFKTKEEEQAFDKICVGVMTSEDIARALRKFDKLQISQRKKIKLNVNTIKAVAEKQSKVAGVLGELLTEEEEEVAVAVQQLPVKEEVVPAPNRENNHKVALFQLFIDNSYKINKEEVNIFARSHGLFTSQFVEGINDEHYEELDDILIEEDEEHYILNESYYQQLKENE